MLKNIHPLLTPDLLYALSSMGHGDEIAICDANFPAFSVAKSTTMGKVISLKGISSAPVVEALLSVFPLDTFVDHAIERMQIVDDPISLAEVQQEVSLLINRLEGRVIILGAVERFAFYQRAKQSFCIVQTGETRPYGCFLFKKGVL